MNPNQPPNTAPDLLISLGKDRLIITAKASWAGEDLLVLITGGDQPHLGAVAAATPRPSLADPSKNSATASVITYLGHKEDGPAKEIAEALASGLNTKVVVAAGMHWEGISTNELSQVTDLLEAANPEIDGGVAAHPGIDSAAIIRIAE